MTPLQRRPSGLAMKKEKRDSKYWKWKTEDVKKSFKKILDKTNRRKDENTRRREYEKDEKYEKRWENEKSDRMCSTQPRRIIWRFLESPGSFSKMRRHCACLAPENLKKEDTKFEWTSEATGTTSKEGISRQPPEPAGEANASLLSAKAARRRPTEELLKAAHDPSGLCFLCLFLSFILAVGYFLANFERLVLGCIEAELRK